MYLNPIINSPVALWVAAMSRQLWFILKGDPAFNELNKLNRVLFSFMSLYVVAGSIRWGLAEGYPIETSLISAIIYALIIGAGVFIVPLGNPEDKVKLFSVILGVSILIDLIGASLYVIGVPKSITSLPLTILELAGYAWMSYKLIKHSLGINP